MGVPSDAEQVFELGRYDQIKAGTREHHVGQQVCVRKLLSTTVFGPEKNYLKNDGLSKSNQNDREHNII